MYLSTFRDTSCPTYFVRPGSLGPRTNRVIEEVRVCHRGQTLEVCSLCGISLFHIFRHQPLPGTKVYSSSPHSPSASASLSPCQPSPSTRHHSPRERALQRTRAPSNRRRNNLQISDLRPYIALRHILVNSLYPSITPKVSSASFNHDM